MPRYGGSYFGTAYKTPRVKTKAPRRGTVTSVAKAPLNLAAKPDPFQDPSSYINRSVSRLGTAQTDEQIRQSAQGMLSPLVSQITGEIGRQGQAGTAAIGGYTSELAKSLAGYQQSAANIYGSAEQSQAASDAVLSSRLSGGGEQQASELAGRLASINAPNATGQAVAGVQQTGTGAGNAVYASGSAALADLIARGAAEQSYAAKLPGFAGLAGLQQTGQLQGRLQSSLAEQLGQVQSQVPGLVSGMQGQRADLLSSQETLRARLREDAAQATARKTALAQEAQAFGLKKKATKVSQTQAQERLRQSGARVGISQYNAQTSRARLSDQEAKDARTQANADRSFAEKVREFDKRQTLAVQKGLKGKPLSPSSKRQALEAADLFRYGKPPVTRADGSESKPGIPNVKYGQAIKRLQAGYGLSRKQAVEMANLFWAPGEFGRPARPQKMRRYGQPGGIQTQVPQG